jgi:hypothetical protein
MLCVNGHNNWGQATACGICGVTTFQNPVTVTAAGGTTNGLAIASMVLGIVWLWGLGAILALIFGYVAKRQIRDTGQRGGGMATAGIVLGWVGIIGTILITVLLVTAAHNLHNLVPPPPGQP